VEREINDGKHGTHGKHERHARHAKPRAGRSLAEQTGLSLLFVSHAGLPCPLCRSCIPCFVVSGPDCLRPFLPDR
jgi:hypothetical protein